MKQYKIIIEQKMDKVGDVTWHFEGPEGHFLIPKKILPLTQVQLEHLLTKCGFVVEWREMNDPA